MHGITRLMTDGVCDKVEAHEDFPTPEMVSGRFLENEIVSLWGLDSK
jgi:hypothetical protein